MKTQFFTGISTHKDSYEAGVEVATQVVGGINSPATGLLILFCSPQYDYPSLIRGIHTILPSSISLIGCTAAGQFTEKSINKEGVACAFITSDDHQFFCGLGTKLRDYPLQTIKHATTTFPQQIENDLHQSAILLIDGLAGKGEEAVLAASSVLGPHIVFMGGAAADHLDFKKTSVFCNEKVSTDAVSICLIASKKPIVISVHHGHHPISDALLITKASENILYELDGKPALSVWKNVLRDRLKQQNIDIDALSIEELSKILLKYEAGLMTGNEYKIRFPSSCNADGSLNFTCSMMEGSVIKIMSSEKEDQIISSRRAAEIALSAVPKGTKIAGAIIFDCACRAMILKDEFSKAIEASREVLGKIPFIGCETYGEIAMNAGQLSGFHNTSTAIMLLPA